MVYCTLSQSLGRMLEIFFDYLNETQNYISRTANNVQQIIAA